MIKLSFDFNLDESELGDLLKSRIDSVVATLAADAEQKGQQLAAEKLKTGLDHWKKGFKIHRVDDGMFVISVEGKLASWMEEGIKPGEVSRSIMSGNRATQNKGQGKNYVDVPFGQKVNPSGGIGRSGVNVQSFANSEQLRRSVSFSDYKNRSIRQEQRIISRIEDIIKSTDPGSGKTSYLTIRRVTEDSNWPSSPFEGANVLEDLSLFIEEHFQDLLERMI